MPKAYRYGFNGKEKDNLDILDFGERIYDSRVCRFLSVDRLARAYPSQSPYSFAGDNPILFIDSDGNGPDLPPGHITTALLTNHPIGLYALLASNNTSPNQLYKWATKKSSDPMAFFKIKGAFGEAQVFKRLLSDMNLSKEGLGIPGFKTYMGGYYKGLQVDIQTKISSYTDAADNRHSVGIRNFDFHGNELDLAVYGRYTDASYTINYEVKTLSPNNEVGFNFRKLSEGISQTIARSQGSNTIGVLVTDKQTWQNVANDEVYGPQLKALYDKLVSTNDSYLRLEENLNQAAQKELMSAYSTIQAADAKKQASDKKKK
jgi:RHS repeat-associated protein